MLSHLLFNLRVTPKVNAVDLDLHVQFEEPSYLFTEKCLSVPLTTGIKKNFLPRFDHPLSSLFLDYYCGISSIWLSIIFANNIRPGGVNQI
ncbi:hypothetical protein TNIN_433441 [Trichonephila inaurata madagascariensis]|uniref:Uncharacterized protein n=1 Tax=Trichonephila inaurata madagascariensis TaxID=2747483 RepID=A0A8X6XEM0_9ARAC|nr:hypothetical protein TNIN_433441 [Trichonephila inaurata madagascariensis]